MTAVKQFSAWEADVIIANLTTPWRSWLHEYERAAGRGDHVRAEFCLDHLLFFDQMIRKVRSAAFPEEID